MDEFKKCYLEQKEPLHFKKCQITDTETESGEFATLAKVLYTENGVEKSFEGIGNGPIDAVQRGMEEALGINIKVLDLSLIHISERLEQELILAWIWPVQ